VIRLSMTSTVMIRGSLLATMVIPCLQNALQVIDNDSPDMVQFVRCKAMIRTHHDKGQLKLAHHALAARVDMGGS
jgi:hypothetical protein